ncbi:MAG: YbhB/YbcL family Raf kinase inhibitor-like protein [Armatimonadetes bacterium]|nr:YbhB/YbcL family Raf kinase inhibitor-like protein [Armatimonadota bacterium]
MARLRVASPAFAAGGGIPAQYTCQGQDTPPPLSWEAGPAGTVSYALVVEDPDAPRGTWVHWVVWNIAGNALPATELTEGRNSWGRSGYGGPCPPSGRHRYCFRVYALSDRLGLPSTAGKEQLLAAMEGKLLAQGELMGTYQKSK